MKQLTTLVAILAIAGSMAAAQAAPAEADKAPAAGKAMAEEPAAKAETENVKADVVIPPAVDTAAVDEKRRKAEERREARKQAAAKKEEERKARQAAWEARCVIKPAMSNEEIATCREVRTQPAPAGWSPAAQ